MVGKDLHYTEVGGVFQKSRILYTRGNKITKLIYTCFFTHTVLLDALGKKLGKLPDEYSCTPVLCQNGNNCTKLMNMVILNGIYFLHKKGKLM